MLFVCFPARDPGLVRLSPAARLAPLALAVALALAVSTGCSDNSGSSTTPDADAEADGSDVTVDPVEDVDTGQDPVDEPDGSEEIGDVEDEEVSGPCPGSISCFDPILDRPRASICVQAGYSTGVSCDLTEDRMDACCVPPFACETNADCEAAREEEGFCVDERFACVCNPVDGSCGSFVCLTDDECEGDDVCRGGVCEPVGSTAGLVAHFLSPSGVLLDGEMRQLLAVAVDPADPERVFPGVALTWTSDDTDAVTVSTSGLATGGATGGAAVITVKVADNASDPGDTITLHNYTEATADLRVVALDENTHGPLAGALVYVEPATGDPVSGTTGDDGVFEVEDTLARPLAVSVFDADHTYVTHVGVEGSDLLVSAAPVAFAEVTNPEGSGSESRVCEETLCYDLVGVGAVTGVPDFDLVANTGEIEVSLSGFSLGNALLDLNFELIVGPNVERDLSGGPIPVDGLSEIPGGVTLAFNAEPLVADYVLTATPGERVLWSLGGRVNLSDNPTLLPDIISQLNGNIDIAQLISIVLPLFDNFYSGVASGVDVVAPEGEDLHLTEVDQALSIPVSRRVFITPPTVPSTSAGELETGVFLAGASVPGLGFLPLGITAAADGANDTPTDGVLDGDTSDADVDAVTLNFAPLHGGIQGPGTGYVLVSVALPLDAANAANQGENSSGIITRVAPGEALPNEITFTREAFPAFPEGTSYDIATRTVTIAPNEDFDADFYRVLFRGERGRNWQIHFAPASTSYVVPDPTAIGEGLEDRTARHKVNVLSVAFEASADLDYEGILDLDGPTLDNLVDFVAAFALLEIEATDSGGE